MKLSSYNLEDGQPVLSIEAETIGEKVKLEELLEELHSTQLKAIPNMKAGTGNSCGSEGDNEGILDLKIWMQLGGEVEVSERISRVNELLRKALKLLKEG